MEKEKFSKLGKKARTAMIINSLIFILISVIVLTIIWIILHSLSIPKEIKKIDEVITYAILTIEVIFLIAEPTIGYNNYKYRINEKSIEIVKGVFFVNREIVPIRRIQQISINKGPVLNLFKLANIHVVTSGSAMKIEYLPKEKAEIIVEKLWKEVNDFAEKQLLNTEDYDGIIDSIEER